MKDYRQEEKIVQAYTSSENNEEIYEMTFNCAEVVELMQIAVKNLALSAVGKCNELLCEFIMQYDSEISLEDAETEVNTFMQMKA